VSADVAIIGSGMGGSTMAYALRNFGARIVVLERGPVMPREARNSSVRAVVGERCYHTEEEWQDGRGVPFRPRTHYVVGGNTKFYGAGLPRFREQDFSAIEHREGTSPAWPFGYAELEPFYADAERLYRVHGAAGADPTDPPRSTPYPFPPVPHDPAVADAAHRLRAVGLTPYPLPLGVDVRPGGGCVRCDTCDGFPCRFDAKSDAQVCALTPALRTGSVSLLTGATVFRLDVDARGRRVVAATGRHNGNPLTVVAGTFVVSCGAINSAALLLRSSGHNHPQGLGNGSGLLGRRYMVHNSTRILAIDPAAPANTVFQKTLAINDFYFGSPSHAFPMGNLQLTGKLHAPSLAEGWDGVLAEERANVVAHSVDWQAISEDLPTADNRVTISPSGRIQLSWNPTNLAAHRALVHTAITAFRDAGYQRTITAPAGIAAVSHQCGTAVAGADPTKSVLDPYCRSHELSNLFVVDASFFPSSAALNPALTVAAQSLRVAADGGVLP
jgi:choline dehydrogenase-like flavoprotein